MTIKRTLARATIVLSAAVVAGSVLASPASAGGKGGSGSSQTVNVRDFGAKGDAVTDDTAAIQAAIDSVSGTGGTVLIPPGRYYTSRALTVSASNVAIQGGGLKTTTIRAGGAATGSGADGFRITKPGPHYSNIAIRDLTIRMGLRSDGNGITLQGCDDCAIERVRIRKPFGFGIMVGARNNSDRIRNAVIRDIIVRGERNGNDSIGGGNITTALFENIRVIDPAGTGIDITNMTDGMIRHVVVIQTGTPLQANWGISTDFGWQNVTVEDTYVSGMYFGYYVGSISKGESGNVKFVNVRSDRSAKMAMFLQGTAGHDIDGFEITGARFLGYDMDGAGVPGILVTEALHGSISRSWIDQPATPSYSIRLGDAGTSYFDAGPASAGVRYTQVVQNVLDPDYQVSTSPDTGGYSDPNSVVVAENVASSPNAEPVAVSVSPFTYSNTKNQLMAVDILGGAVSEIAKNGQLFSSVSPAVVWLQPGENVQVEYGQAAPAMHQLALPS